MLQTSQTGLEIERFWTAAGKCACTLFQDEDFSLYTGTFNDISPVPLTRTVKSLDSDHTWLLLRRPLTSSAIYFSEEEMFCFAEDTSEVLTEDK